MTNDTTPAHIGADALSRDEIIAMAREAGFVLADNATDEALNRFRAFAALVAAREREACARICEHVEAQKWSAYKGQDGPGSDRSPRTEGMADGAGLCAQMIRARGADPDLARLTARGATAWAGVDAQALREGRMPHND